MSTSVKILEMENVIYSVSITGVSSNRQLL
jgi:hypothetical protein